MKSFPEVLAAWDARTVASVAVTAAQAAKAAAAAKVCILSIRPSPFGLIPLSLGGHMGVLPAQPEVIPT